MPVSPQDFALYSRMTGSPVPTDAATRMQMAPDVYKFTKDFAKKPNILETTGNLVKTIGKNVGMGMALAAASPGFVKEPKTTSENYDQTEVPNQTAKKVVKESLKRGAELADSTNVAEELSESEESRPAFGPDFDEQVGLPATSERVSGFLSQFPALEGKESPNIDPVLMGAIDQRRIPTEIVGRGLDGPASTISAGLNRFEHPDIKADGGEHDDDLVGAGNFKPVVMETEPSTSPTPEIVKKPAISERVDDFKSKFVEGAYSIPIQGQFHGKSLGLTVIPATNGEAQRGFVIANKAVDSSPTTATTYGFGISPKSEDYLKDYPITEQNFDTMMQRGMTEAKQRGKRKAGEIFGYLSQPKRVVTGKAQLGGFGQIDPDFGLPNMVV